MEDNKISIKEESQSKENITNIQSKNKNKNKISLKDNLIGKNPKKRTRDYSPSMDIEEEQISFNKDSFNNRNKRMKIPLRKMVERISLEDENDTKILNKNNIKGHKNKNKLNKKKGIKIFSDMSVSEISNNLFKNFYPCLLPSYYPDQITEQIIDSQIDKLISNFNRSKDIIHQQNKIKINPNLDYLRQLAEKQGEWIFNDKEEQIYDDHEEDVYDDDKSDSNNENNSNNTYPEDESIENENKDNSFENYDDYDNNDNYNDNSEDNY